MAKEKVTQKAKKHAEAKHKKEGGPKKIGMRSKFSAKHHSPIGEHEGHAYKGK